MFIARLPIGARETPSADLMRNLLQTTWEIRP
jgi:hypothetical protein